MKKIILKTKNLTHTQKLLQYVLHYESYLMADNKEGFYNFKLWANERYKIVVYHTKTAIIGIYTAI